MKKIVVRLYFFSVIAFILSACSTSPKLPPVAIPSTDTGQSTSQDVDGAPQTSKDIATIVDAVPTPVRRTRAGNKSPYTVFGKTYQLLPDSQGYQERGYASWYGTKFHGNKTANGEAYDMWGMTAAHKTLPIPSYVRVTNPSNGRSVVVRVNDRGPFHDQRIIDLSYAAAVKLGFAEKGVELVDVVDVTPTANPLEEPSAIRETPPPTSDSKSQSQAIEPVLLQAAAFQKIENAQRLQGTLSQQLSAPVNVVPNNTNTWYRVRIGPIKDKALFAQVQQVLAEQGIQKPTVIKVK